MPLRIVALIGFLLAMHAADAAPGCRFRVGPDGTVRDTRTHLPMNAVVTRTIILALCVSSRPFTSG